MQWSRACGSTEGPGTAVTRSRPGWHWPGRVNWKIAPRGEFGTVHRRPACASTIERQMTSPMPMPSALVVNSGVKIRAASSARTPAPVSATEIMMPVPWYASDRTDSSLRFVLCGHRVNGIGNQVEQQVLQLDPVSVNGRQLRSRLDADRDPVGLKTVAFEGQGLMNDFVEVEAAGEPDFIPEDAADASHHLAGAVPVRRDPPERLPGLLQVRYLAIEQTKTRAGARDDGGERLADFMGDRCSDGIPGHQARLPFSPLAKHRIEEPSVERRDLVEQHHQHDAARQQAGDPHRVPAGD